MHKIDTLFQEYPFLIKLFNNIPVGIYLCDEEGTILFINDAIADIDGYSLEEVRGKNVLDVYNTHDSAMMKILNTKEDINHFLCAYHHRDGTEISQLCNGFPIVIDDAMVGACSIEFNTDFVTKSLKQHVSLHSRLIGDTSSESQIFENVVGKSSAFLNCLSIANLAAQTDSSVFISGATGTGKEVFAKAIHEASSRKDKPFAAFNCAAIPENLIESILFGSTKGIYTGAVDHDGLFIQNNGGTIFLDELNSMPLSAQAKLLRVLEERSVTKLGSNESIPLDVRFISSSNISPQEAINNKLIREDLFYRLSVINILIPSLKDRRDDILLLARHFIEQYNETLHKNILSVSDSVKEVLEGYQWPGNVRQLKHCIESAMVFAEPHDTTLEARHMETFLLETKQDDPAFADASPESQVLPKEVNVFDEIKSAERQAIIAALDAHNGNVTLAAKDLKISRQTLNYRMKKYGVQRTKKY